MVDEGATGRDQELIIEGAVRVLVATPREPNLGDVRGMLTPKNSFFFVF